MPTGGVLLGLVVLFAVIGIAIGRAIKRGYGWVIGGLMVFGATYLNTSVHFKPEVVPLALGVMGIAIAFTPGTKDKTG